MRERLIAGSLVVVAALLLPARAVSAPADAPSEAMAEILDRYDKGIVYLSCRNRKGEEMQMGSGFVIDPKGLVATCFHVLRGASIAEARFADGTKVRVKGLRAWDVAGDLAIVELVGAPKGIQALALSRETRRRVGEDVIAIGHPYGFKFTPTLGIISGVHTTAELPPPFRDATTAPASNVWILTSAGVSVGSSGGPLLTRKGEVIGVMTWMTKQQRFGVASDVRHLAALQAGLSTQAVALADFTGPEEALRDLMLDYANQMKWHRSEASQSQDQASRHPSLEYLPRLWEFAERHRDKPVEAMALKCLWLMAALPDCPAECGFTVKRVGRRTLEAQADNPEFVESVLALGNSPLWEAADFLRRLRERTRLAPMRAAAGLALANTMDADGEHPEKADEALRLVEQVIKEAPEVELNDSKVRELAEPLAFKLKHLVVGRTALDIVGPDQQGRRFKLSDYRGKVVVLDFWADWCPYCRQMYPHERRLVKAYANRPFALLGVNSDEPARLRRVVDSGEVTWRSWSDGRGGSIGTEWQIESVPTVFILDHKGVIRYRDVRGSDLDEAVATLLKELESRVVTPNPAGTFCLEADTARLYGDLKIEVQGKESHIGRWLKPADWVSWKVNFNQPGKFKVTVDCATTERASAFVVEVGRAKTEGKVLSTGSWDKYLTVDAGVIEITQSGEQVVKLRPKDPQNWKPIALRRVKLERAR